jgi:hypothetical protein
MSAKFELRTHPTEPIVEAIRWKPGTWPKGARAIWRGDVFVALQTTLHQPPSNHWRLLTKPGPTPRAPLTPSERARRDAHKARVHAEQEARERQQQEYATRELQARIARGENIFSMGKTEIL